MDNEYENPFNDTDDDIDQPLDDDIDQPSDDDIENIPEDWEELLVDTESESDEKQPAVDFIKIEHKKFIPWRSRSKQSKLKKISRPLLSPTESRENDNKICFNILKDLIIQSFYFIRIKSDENKFQKFILPNKEFKIKFLTEFLIMIINLIIQNSVADIDPRLKQDIKQMPYIIEKNFKKFDKNEFTEFIKKIRKNWGDDAVKMFEEKLEIETEEKFDEFILSLNSGKYCLTNDNFIKLICNNIENITIKNDKIFTIHFSRYNFGI